MAQRFAVLTNELIRRGKNVELLSTQSLTTSLDIKRREGMHLIDDPQGRVTFKAYILLFVLMMKIMFRRYNQVHMASGGSITNLIIILCKFSRTKISCTFASTNLEAASYGRSETREKWISVLNRVDAIDVLVPNYDLPDWKEKISISPCSFLSKEKLIPLTYNRTREDIVVFCGALEKIKNPILAIDIAREFERQNPGMATMVIFGQGVLYDQVRLAAKQTNKVAGREFIKFGNFSDYFDTLSRANVFFSLQEIDNYPSQSLIEAMRMGCKVIATDEGATKLMLPPEEQNNFLVSSRNPSDFVMPLKTALSNKNASKANANYAKSYHSIERFIPYFLNIVGLR